jgi:predicted DCC family thiol-disulfide oxidoreductase YuxK
VAADADFDVEVFFDGDCPLCMKEIRMLQRLDRRRQRIRFTNIAAADFDPTTLGMDWDTLMRRIHARLPDGSFIEGVEVFRRLYGAVGFGPLVWMSRAPGVSGLLDWGYTRFAANRLKWTGRCTDACEIPARRAAA